MSYISNSSSNTVVNGTNSADSLFSDGVNVTIYGGGGNDSITNSGEYVRIYAGDGKDTVYNYSNYSTIYGETGNDYIYSDARATVYGGDGNDTISVGAGYLSGGNGDDIIDVKTYATTTINGGKGNDTITNTTINYDYGHIYEYVNGDGNDVIYGFNSKDTLQLTGSGYSTVKSGNDVIIKVGNGSMTLKDAVGKNLNIVTVAKQSSTKKTQQDVIKDFMHSLDKTELGGESALNEAVLVASGGKFTSYRNLIESFVSDCKNNSVDKFLKDFCSIDLNNEDTGAITGWDAGGIVTKTAKSVIEEVGILKDYRKNFRLTNPKSGLTLVWNEPVNVTENQKNIVSALYSWWFSDAMDLVIESYGMDFKNLGDVHEITLDFNYYKNKKDLTEEEEKKVSGWLAAVISDWDYNVSPKTTGLTLWINDDIYKSLNLSKDTDGKPPVDILETISFEAIAKFFLNFQDQYLDATVAHEMTHAVMSANINYFY